MNFSEACTVLKSHSTKMRMEIIVYHISIQYPKYTVTYSCPFITVGNYIQKLNSQKQSKKLVATNHSW